MNLNTLNVDIKSNIKDYIIFKPINKNELKEAVDLWCENKILINLMKIYLIGMFLMLLICHACLLCVINSIKI